MTVYKKDLVNEYAAKKGITKTEAAEIIDDIFKIVSDNLCAGNDVKISNFFNFFVRNLSEKKGKNPYTNEPMVIPAVRSVHARMTKPLKDRIQGKRE